jgi:hypothetical protein
VMRKASTQGKIKGVLSHMLSEGITHIQYADDMILMIDGDDESVTNLKFILHYF